MMDQDRMAEVKVGVFVIAALGILVVGSLWVTGLALWRGETARYDVLMNDSGGIQTGDRVRLAGVEVGRVEQVRLEAEGPERVRFTVGIAAGMPLYADSRASVSSAGLLGAPFLQISPGSADLPPLPPGSTIPGRSGPGLDDTLARVDEIGEKVLALLDSTTSLVHDISLEVEPLMVQMGDLLSAENTANIQGMLADARALLRTSGPHVGQLIERLESVASRLDETLVGAPALTARLEELLGGVEAALGPDGARLGRLLESGESSLESADQVLSIISGRRAELEDTLSTLHDALVNLREFSQIIKERPFSLVRIRSESDRRPGEGVREVRP